MTRYLRNLLLGLTAAMLTMCNTSNSKLSDVAVIVSPGASTPVTLHAGEQALYSVYLTTAHDYVASLKITSFDPQNGLTTCLEESLNSTTVERQFAFCAPALDRDSVEIVLSFQATDNLGNTAAVERKINVLNKAIAIAEKNGIVLYNPISGLPDALALTDVSNPFNLADSPRPETADIYLTSTADFDSISWRSNTNLKFLRNNSFDYPSATPSAITATFAASVRTDAVSNIRANDVIIVGHGNMAQGVFYVSNIIRTPENRACIQLSYKGISR